MVVAAVIAAGAILGVSYFGLHRNKAEPRSGAVAASHPTTGRALPVVEAPIVSSTSKSWADSWAAALSEPARAKRREKLLELARRCGPAAVAQLLAWCEGLADSALRADAYHAVLTHWSSFSGALAVAYAQNLPETDRSDDLLARVVQGWAEADFGAAVRWFAAESMQTGNEQIAQALMAALRDLDSERVFTFVQKVTNAPARLALCRALVDRFVADNPAGAGDLVVRLTQDSVRSELLGKLLVTWGQSDWDGALEWAQRLPSGPAQTTALIHLSYAWTSKNPGEAAAFAHRLPTGAEQFLTIVASQWAERDPEAAAGWAKQLPPSREKDRVLASLTQKWAERDVASAIGFVQGLPPGPAREDAFISVISAWARSEPATAMQWALATAAGRQREYALENIFYQWTRTDPVASVAWLSSLPPGPERDAAIHAGAGSLVDVFPDLAAQWAAAIADDRKRIQQMERAARAWLAVDPTAAQGWIRQANLPAALKQNLVPAPRP